MKKSQLNENNFETEHVVKVLVEENGYIERSPEDFEKDLCLDSSELVNFLKETQPEEWEKFVEQYDNPEKRIGIRVSEEIEKRGTLDVLRGKISDKGARFEMAYFKPVSGLNLDHEKLYNANRFSVIRQLKYSEKYQNSVDVVLFLNGIPIITSELKNHFTGQKYYDAISQYRYNRDSHEPLFKNCLAHFAVDNDSVFFTTKLEDKSTTFLPFNKDITNPDDPRGFKVSYLYYDFWSKDSLLEIIKHYLTVVENKDSNGRVKGKTLIFPRIHQINSVRDLVNDTLRDGVGKNYLIQHSAGSGKTFTISWLAHHLAELHREEEAAFDSVIIVSDRRVIDRQLRDAVEEFQKTLGVVVWADRSATLKDALANGKKIIVTTLQKFNIVAESIEKLSGSKFAVLIDEAHSSQGGESTRAVNKTLTYSSLDEAEQEEEGGQEELSPEEYAIKEMRERGQIGNVSFFAFTATPKSQTLELFGRKNESGESKPHSLYSMHQAIKEGFILDVLENYTTYKTYFKLVKKIEEDPEYERDKATALLRKYVDLQDHAIKEKTQVMLDHFFGSTQKEIKGNAKAMVTTRSRLHAVRFKLAFDRELRERGMNHVRTLVAFTGTVRDNGYDFTESTMNRVSESRTREEFSKPNCRILIVANKYQTGFDEPLLQTMYVDKKLKGVNAVQTLSRLNRKIPNKDKVVIIDFVNEADDIQKSFQPFYKTTILSEGTDPNTLYDYERKIIEWKIIDEEEVNFFYEIWVKEEDQSKLHQALTPAVERFAELEKEKKKEFRKLLQSYIKVYGFIAQIASFSDPRLEKLYQYIRFLIKKLPLTADSLPKEVLDSVDLNTFGLKETYSGTIQLMDKDDPLGSNLPNNEGKEPSPKERLSMIIERINEISGMEIFSNEDVSKFEELSRIIENNEEFELSKQAKNDKEALKLLFDEIFEDKFSDMHERDFNFFKKIENNQRVRETIKKELFKSILK